MPAIEISKLRAKINLLVKLIDDPEKLIQELIDFYESYSDLTFQSGSFSVKSGDLPAYRTPTLMNRELENVFIKVAASEPEKILPVIDLLAARSQLEPRQLACALLGALPAQYFDQVTHRISEWAGKSTNSDDLVWIFKLGTKTLRTESPETWLKMLKTWIDSANAMDHRIAVLGLTSMLDDAALTSLPLIFKFLQPILSESNSRNLPYLESILEKLVEKSEKETLFFIKQVLKQSPDPLLIRMLRRNISIFSPEGQESLRSFLRSL